MKVKDKVYVIDWGKQYTTLKLPAELQPLIDRCYTTIDHWEYIYEPNYTLKGTINKREPKKLVDKIPLYKNYKYRIAAIFKHPKAGEYTQTEEIREYWKDKGGADDKYTEKDLLLLISIDSTKYCQCYVIIEESGVSKLTSEQYKNEQFNSLIENNLGKWDREIVNSTLKVGDNDLQIPKEIRSVFYDSNDNVLFGSHMVKGLVTYEYLDAKFSIDNKPIYLGCSILYDGKGNSEVKDNSLIKDFKYIKSFLEQK